MVLLNLREILFIQNGIQQKQPESVRPHTQKTIHFALFSNDQPHTQMQTQRDMDCHHCDDDAHKHRHNAQYLMINLTVSPIKI